MVIDNCHESVLCRSYHILAYVQVLLEAKTPPEVILDIIEMCYEKDHPQIHESTMEEIRKEIK